MSRKRKKFDYRWFLCWGLAVVAVGVLVALLTSPRYSIPVTVPGAGFTVSVDTNGTAWLGGAQLPPKIRDGAFSALGAVGAKARFSLPAAYADGTSASKAADMIASMYRAGLLTTNQPNNP
jgi:hypothetical protein